MKEPNISLLPSGASSRRYSLSLVLTCVLCCFAATTHAETNIRTEQLIRDHIDAIGGRAKLKELNSLSMQGTIESDGLVEELYITRKRGDKLRISFINEDIIQSITYDGENGWEIMENAGTRGEPASITGRQLEILKAAAAFTPPLLNFPNNDWTFTAGSPMTIQGKECPQIIVQDKAGNEHRLYLDPQTNYVLQKESALILPNSDNAETLTFTTTYDNIELLDGYAFAYTTNTTDQNGRSSTMSFDKILINAGVFDSAFTPPSK